MRSPPPAAAALLLAALAALPYRGTEADVTSALLAAENERRASPSTLSRVYRRLHAPYLALAGRATRGRRSPDRRIYNSNLTSAECSVNKMSGRQPVQQAIRTSCGTPPRYSGAEGSDFSKSSPERNHKRRKRIAPPGPTPPAFLEAQLFKEVKSSRREYAVSTKASTLPEQRTSVGTTTAESPGAAAALRDGSARPPATVAAGQDRRRKPGDPGSGAPLLNYIFDTYSNTHQHRNDRLGGGGGGGRMTAAEPAVEALVGSTAQLDCKVDALHDKLVSWVRRKSDGEGMELLTTGTQKYTADDRYSALFLAPDTWRLEIRDVRAADAALYDCQLPAHPPRTARVALHVPAVSVAIVDGAGAPVAEQVCEVGSTVTLRCVVRGLRMEGGRALHWYRRDALLNDDTTRGGISVRTELGAEGAESVLRVARVRGADGGRYTCDVHAAPRARGLAPAHVALHVIQGESLAELHAGGGGGGGGCGVSGGGTIALLIFTLICSFNLHLYSS